MNAATLVLIALGGALGSVLRALAGWALAGRAPLATLIVNVAGSLLIGWLMGRLALWEPTAASRGQALLVVGFCGGFTTFSTFSWQTFEQMQQGRWGLAAGNVLLSVGLCLAAVWLGLRLGRA